ncbi:MAG: ABC transporter substrate binding protein, partial [Oscillospiraceae bacterium]
MKKFLSVLLALSMVASLAGCSKDESVSKDSEGQQTGKIKIGILQYMEHGALDEAKNGFVAALAEGGFVDGENIEIDFQNAQADQSNLLTMSQRFVNNKSD